MAVVLKNRVYETSTTIGTVSFVLLGAVTGYQSFSTISGGVTYYTIQGKNDDGTLTGQWEVGQGTYTAGTLSRDTVIDSSNAGALVAFSAGIKDVFCDLPAEMVPSYPGAGIPNSTGSAWGTSYTTSGSGTVVALSDSPTFTTAITATGALQLTGSATVNQNIATTQTTGTLSIGGNGSVTGLIDIASSPRGGLNLGVGASADTRNAKLINIGTGSIGGKTSINIGSASGNSVTTFNGTVAVTKTASGSFSTTAPALLNGVTYGGSLNSDIGSVAIGLLTLQASSSGLNNVGIGYNSLSGITGGNNNVAIGANSGISGIGINGSIYIGSSADGIGSNEIVIGTNVGGQGTNTTSIGTSSTLNTYLYGVLNIGGNGTTTNQNIATNQTTSNIAIGGFSGTGTITLGQSTATQTVNIATGANTATKTVAIGTGSASGATNITIGATTGTSTTTVNGLLKQQTYTVGTLPTGSAGARSFVTDSLTPAFGSAVVGGGTVGVPVYHDGTSWKVG